MEIRDCRLNKCAEAHLENNKIRMSVSETIKRKRSYYSKGAEGS